jgi:hypothetical protein
MRQTTAFSRMPEPFPSFSEIHAVALKVLRQEIAAAGSTAGGGSR